MTKLDCPYCGQACVSVVGKTFVGAGVKATCQACGRKVRVPWLSVVVEFIPFIPALVHFHSDGPFSVTMALMGVGLAVTLFIHVCFVPLVHGE